MDGSMCVVSRFVLLHAHICVFACFLLLKFVHATTLARWQDEPQLEPWHRRLMGWWQQMAARFMARFRARFRARFMAARL